MQENCKAHHYTFFSFLSHSSLTSIYSHVQFVVKKSRMLYIVAICNMILSTALILIFHMEALKSILFPCGEKTQVSVTNPPALQLKLLRTHMESAPLREKTVMHALQLF